MPKHRAIYYEQFIHSDNTYKKIELYKLNQSKKKLNIFQNRPNMIMNTSKNFGIYSGQN